MAGKAPTFKGKTKGEIAEEAFRQLGPTASREQVDKYFRVHYNLPGCETSMFWTAKGNAKRAAGIKTQVKDNQAQAIKEADDQIKQGIAQGVVNHQQGVATVSLVKRVKELAGDLGGYDKLEELIDALK